MFKLGFDCHKAFSQVAILDEKGAVVKECRLVNQRAALAALEIAAINRFTSPGKLTAYAGLVPTTYASGGKVHHGDLLPQCNRYLRYAFVEAAWSAVKSSPYCRALFAKLRKRKGANTAIIVVARRLCGIAYLCLKENRLYEERAYDYDHRV